MKIVVLLFLGLLVSGCEAVETPFSGVSIRDSAGVRIVEYDASPSGPLSFATEPVFVHGLDPDDYLFQRAWAGALREDGGAIMIDGANQEVVFFGPLGEIEHVARKGEGPGELSRPMTVHVLGGDTVLIEDDGNARFSLFAGAELLRTIGTAGDYSLTQGLMIRGLTPGGHYIMTTSSYRTDFEEPWFKGTIAVFRPDEAITDTVATFDMAPRRPSDGKVNPFGSYGLAIASGGRAIVGRTDRPELRWLSEDGALDQIVRWTPESSFPTQVHWDEFEASLRVDLARMNPNQSGEQLSAFIEGQLDRYVWDPSDAFPAFGPLTPDGSGGVWMGDYAIRGGADGPRRFSVISATGEWMGTIAVPDRFRLLALRNGRALGVVRDDMDVQSVAVYEILGAPES